jgi:hypothetical protein
MKKTRSSKLPVNLEYRKAKAIESGSEERQQPEGNKQLAIGDKAKGKANC